MERRFRVCVGFVAAILCLVVPLAPASAQDTTAFGQLKGLKLAVERSYSAGAGNIVTASHDPNNAKLIMSASAYVAQFDSSSDAQAGMKFLTGQLDSLTSDFAGDAVKVQSVKVDKTGDETVGYSGINGMLGPQDTLDLVITRNGGYVQVVIVDGFGKDLMTRTVGLAKVMSGRAASGTVTTDANGVHAGGIWNVFPAGKDVPPELSVAKDDQIFPVSLTGN